MIVCLCVGVLVGSLTLVDCNYLYRSITRRTGARAMGGGKKEGPLDRKMVVECT
jgi:hypothetical protein